MFQDSPKKSLVDKSSPASSPGDGPQTGDGQLKPDDRDTSSSPLLANGGNKDQEPDVAKQTAAKVLTSTPVRLQNNIYTRLISL